MLSTPSPLMLALRPQNPDFVISSFRHFVISSFRHFDGELQDLRVCPCPFAICSNTGRVADCRLTSLIHYGMEFDHYLVVMVHKPFPFRCNILLTCASFLLSGLLMPLPGFLIDRSVGDLPLNQIMMAYPVILAMALPVAFLQAESHIAEADKGDTGEGTLQ